MSNDNIKIKGSVKIVVRDKNGKIKETRQKNNLVVNNGLNHILQRMKGTSQNVMSHIALGTGATAVVNNQTGLTSKVGSSKQFDNSFPSITGASITYQASFTPSSPGDVIGAITEAGIFNSSSNNALMLCRIVFSPVNMSATDSMLVNWTISLSAS